LTSTGKKAYSLTKLARRGPILFRNAEDSVPYAPIERCSLNPNLFKKQTIPRRIFMHIKQLTFFLLRAKIFTNNFNGNDEDGPAKQDFQRVGVWCKPTACCPRQITSEPVR
jgi:hypothetical protein